MSGPWDDYKPGAKPSDDGPWADYAKGAPAPAAPAGKSGLIRRGIGDTALSFGQGAVGAVKSLTDLAGPDNAVSEKLGDINEGMAGMLSPERRAELAARQAKIEEADNSGDRLSELTSRLGGFAEAPVQTLAQVAGSMAPTLAAAILTRGKTLPAVAVGAGIGVGSNKGQNYDAVKAEALKQGHSPQDAEALAIKASEYSWQNAPQQALGGVLGALDAGTGVERVVGKLAGGASLGGGDIIQRVLKRGAQEAAPEGLQGSQGQYAENEALNNAGFPTDPWRGVVGSGVHDAAVGFALGGMSGVPKGRQPSAAEQTPQQPQQPPAQELPPQPTAAPGPKATAPDAPPPVNPAAPPVTGPLTAAVAAMAPQSIDGAMPPLPVGATRELDGNDAARVQREADKPGQSVGLILPDDITRGGQPFTSMESAGRALAKAGPGFELARVKGGLVVRRIGAAAPAAAQPSASTLQSGPMARFAARFAQGDNTLARGALDGGVDVQELSIEDANAAAAPQASKKDDKDELIPTGRKRELNLEVVEPASPDGLQPTIDPPRREPRKAQPARDMTDDDVVKAYVEQRRAEGTLAGRRFAGDFDAGRITPEDVLGLVRPRRPTPTADERLQAAAAQRAQPEPATGLVDSDGRPIPTTLKERREQQRNVAGAAELADGASDGRRADAGRGGAAVGRVADVEGARQPGRAPGADSGGIAASPVGDGLRADQALTPDATKQDAAAPAETAPPQGRVPDAAAPTQTGGFDSAKFDAGRAERIKASRDAGNTHLDQIPAYVETMRGKRIYYVHDTKVKGTIRTVDNNGNVYVNWSDAYSAQKEGASPMQDGKKTVMQTSLGPRDLKDYVLDGKPTATQAPPAAAPSVHVDTRKPPAAPTNAKPPAPQTRPEQLIELRKRLSVLNQLLECLG